MRRIAASLFWAALITTTPHMRAAASVPDYGFLPTQIGQSLTYRYEASSSGSTLSTTRAIVTFTLTAPDRLTVTLSPDLGEPFALAASIGTSGTLLPIAPRPEPTPSYAATPQAGPRGFPGGGGYGGGGRYSRRGGGQQSQTQNTQPQRAAPQLPQALGEIASLLAAIAAPGISERTFTFTPNGGTPVTMNVRQTKMKDRTAVVADGTGYGTGLHVEVTLFGNLFSSARGNEHAIEYGKDPSQEPTTTWTLTAFVKQLR